jgi:F0F1-type ATP synthase assembly protein I
MRETDARGPSKNSLRALLLMTAVLLIIAALAFWITCHERNIENGK